MNKGMKILVVEDNYPDACFIEELLTAAAEPGFLVKNARLLSEGLALLGGEHFDLVLLDLNLPDSRGISTAKDLRRQFPAIPIVILTGLADEELAFKSLQMDMQDYLIKGQISRDQLVRSIRYALERKRAMEALREKEEWYRTLFDSIDEGYFVIEMHIEPDHLLDFRVIEANKVFEKQSTLVGAKGKWVRELRPNLEESWYEIYRDVALTGKSIRFEHFSRALEDRWFTVYAFRIGAPEQRRVAILFNDITARRQVEEQLRTLNEELERRVERRTRELQETQSQYLHAEKLSAIGKLSASIAHEFNNPLQGVMTILQGLSKRLKLEQEDKALLDLAVSESFRMKNLIRSLQDFNRPSSGKKVFIDVHAVIDSLLLFCKSDFKRKRIATVLNYAERLPQILAIPDQIKQVFLNLLNNAADACQEDGGVITITTCHEEKTVAVAIQDNGVGIQPDKMDLIFQPFYTTKPEIKGTGLGLSICHGIVQNHQGEIRVESRPGKGSTFTVLLPVYSPLEKKRAHGESAPAG